MEQAGRQAADRGTIYSIGLGIGPLTVGQGPTACQKFQMVHGEA